MAQPDLPKVAIIGAGFGGLWAAKALRGAAVDVEIIDRHNFHTFFPLLYQVAAAELAPGDISHPIRKIIRRHRNARFTLADVAGLDAAEKVLDTSAGPKAFDYLIIAMGSTTKYFGVAGAADHSYPLRTLEDAVHLRNHLLARFETAEQLSPADRAKHLTFVIVGGGPTGVEFAGALQELINGPLRRDHPRLKAGDASVIVVELGDTLLPVYPAKLREYATKRLEQMGVEVKMGAAVESVSEEGVILGGGHRIDAATVVWTAGVGGPSDLAKWGLPATSAGRVKVLPTLQVENAGSVFVVGDSSLPAGGTAPMVAQNATQQGTLAAENILRLIDGQTLQDYRYRDLGNMAVIGRNAAVVHLFSRLGFKGYLAWLMWLGLHLAKLIGFRNRVAALLSWAGDYLFRDRVARLITSTPTDPDDFFD